MKLALCLEYPIDQPGGTEVLVRELVHGLARHHQIVLVSGDSPGAVRESSVAEKIAAHIRWGAAVVNFETSRALAQAIQSHGVDLAHFHFGGNYAWGNRLFNLCPIIHVDRMGIPCCATNHGVFGLWEGYIGPQRSWLVKAALLPPAWMSKLQVLNHLTAEVAVSQADFRTLRQRYWPMRGKFRQIYHSRISERDAAIPKERKKIVLCAGTLGPRKGQPYLARAFAQIAGDFPDWRLVFIGRPGDAQTGVELQELLRTPALANQAEWRPSCSDAELKEWLQQAEVFAMPSMHEGLGLSLQEALYYGAACIASRIGGIPDLIQHGANGILVERANVNELASGLRQLMSDAALRDRLRARGRASILEKDMTAERMVARHEELYRALLKQ